jgi:hypothetical protein
MLPAHHLAHARIADQYREARRDAVKLPATHYDLPRPRIADAHARGRRDALACAGRRTRRELPRGETMPADTQSRPTRPTGAPAYYLGRPASWWLTSMRRVRPRADHRAPQTAAAQEM